MVRETAPNEIDENRRRARQTKLIPQVTKAGVTTHGLSSTTFGHYLKPTVTLGWRPSCECGTETTPCTVLDPFGGSGTTALVADRLGRNAVLIELNPEYAAMAMRRIKGDSPLFVEAAHG
jgi:adenine-specific DNA methylase